MSPPYVGKYEARVTDAAQQRAKNYARQRLNAAGSLALDGDLQELAPKKLTPGRALHLDDYSSIHLGERVEDSRFMQQSACLRAEANDMVAVVDEVDPAFVQYFDKSTGSALEWLTPPGRTGPANLALACWSDRETRRRLRHAIRNDGLAYIHPNISSVAVWELAHMLRNSTRGDLHVIGPPPAVAAFANDKIEFSRLVGDVLGSHYVPRTESACNLSALSSLVLELIPKSCCLGLKIPNSVGGYGNIVLNLDVVRDDSLSKIRSKLKKSLGGLHWTSQAPILVDVWESDVALSASSQTWIPPLDDGEPVVEGIFEQILSGSEGQFLGSKPLGLPLDLESEAVDSSYLLALTLQHLGYVGRCSFEFILVGKTVSECRFELVDCNGRWGGTSAPMTLTNRLFGSHLTKPFISRRFTVGSTSKSFAEIQNGVSDILFEPAANEGWALLFDPGRLVQGELQGIVWGNSTAEAGNRARELEERLAATGPVTVL